MSGLQIKCVNYKLMLSQLRRQQRKCKELEEKLRQATADVDESERNKKRMKEEVAQIRRRYTGEIRVPANIIKRVCKKLRTIPQETKAVITKIYEKALKDLETLRHKYRLPKAVTLRRTLNLGTRVRRHVLSHVLNRKKGQCKMYQRMYDWGSRIGLNLPDFHTRLARFFKEDKDAQVMLMVKFNGVHFSALCRFARDQRGTYRLVVINVQGKNGAWRREENWSMIISNIINGFELEYDEGFFGSVNGTFLIGGEILGPLRGHGASENWRNVMWRVSRAQGVTLVIYDFARYNAMTRTIKRYTLQQLQDILEFWRGYEERRVSLMTMIHFSILGRFIPGENGLHFQVEAMLHETERIGKDFVQCFLDKLNLRYSPILLWGPENYLSIMGFVQSPNGRNTDWDDWENLKDILEARISYVAKYDPFTEEITDYTPEHKRKVIAFLHGEDITKLERKYSIAESILITGEMWRTYDSDMKCKHLTGPCVFVTDGSTSTFRYQLTPLERRLRFLNSNCINFLKTLRDSMQGRMTTAEQNMLADLISAKKFPTEQEAFALYQLIQRFTAHRREESANGTREGPTLQVAEILAVGVLTRMESIQNRQRRTRHETRTEAERKAQHLLTNIGDFISRVRRSSGEGVVLTKMNSEGKKFTYYKSKVSYTIARGCHLCLLTHQKFGILLGYDTSKRVGAHMERSKILSHIFDVIMVYLPTAKNELMILATTHLKWRESNSLASPEIDIDGMICDSSGIAAQTAKRLLYILLSRGTLENLHFARNVGKLHEDNCFTCTVQDGTTVGFRVGGSVRYDYLLFEEPTVSVIATTTSQVVYSEKTYRLHLDGYFIRYILSKDNVKFINPLLAQRLTKYKNLPVSIKTFLAQPVPYVPCLDKCTTTNILRYIVEHNQYSSYEDLTEAVRVGSPLRYVPICTLLSMLMMILSNNKKLIQFNEMERDLLIPMKLRTFNGLPVQTFRDIRDYAQAALIQHAINEAFLQAFQGESPDAQAMGEYESTNLAIEFHMSHLQGQIERVRHENMNWTTTRICRDYLNMWDRNNGDGLRAPLAADVRRRISEYLQRPKSESMIRANIQYSIGGAASSRPTEGARVPVEHERDVSYIPGLNVTIVPNEDEDFLSDQFSADEDINEKLMDDFVNKYINDPNLGSRIDFSSDLHHLLEFMRMNK